MIKQAGAGMPSRGFPRASALVIAIAAAAALALLAGMAGGLVRIGWPLLPERIVSPVALHSALASCAAMFKASRSSIFPRLIFWRSVSPATNSVAMKRFSPSWPIS